MKLKILLALTLMLAGRAMTLPYIGRAGGAAPSDPPAAWLMPLVGDAVIGLGALFVAYLIWKGSSPGAWALAIAWNAIGIWDALSAYLIHLTEPWNSFFMIEIFGPSMFFAASLMHALCIFLLASEEMRQRFWKEPEGLRTS